MNFMEEKSECPFCNIDRTKEKIFFEDEYIIVLRTKNLKKHKERIMVISKRHFAEDDLADHPLTRHFEKYALDALSDIGKKLFNYTPKFVIMDTTFATIKDHWHKVCTDLDPKSEDFEQILKTKWLKVVDTC